jgi:hypothetical protein
MEAINNWFWGKKSLNKENEKVAATYRSKKPVSISEGKELFERAYKNKSKKRKHYDKIRKQKKSLSPGSPDSFKYRNKYKNNKIVERGAIKYDLDGVDTGIIEITSNGELKKKAQILFDCYEYNYKKMFENKKFWKELEKIKDHQTNQSYHDILITKIVNGAFPIGNEKILIKYADVIETAYTIAVKLKLCKPILNKQKGGSEEVITKKHLEEKSESNFIDGLF